MSTQEDNTYELVLQPKTISVPLFEHQKRTIFKMQELERTQCVRIDPNYSIKTLLGINADPTGYGKTLSMVGLVSIDNMKWPINEYYVREYNYSEYQGIVSSTRITKYDRLPCTLVLVSQSIVSQWVEDFKKSSNLSIITVTSRKDIDNVVVEDYDVVIVTLTMYNGLVSRYDGYAWKRFIFDEPGHVRVIGMKPIVAGFTWLVTATPAAMSFMHSKCKNSYMKNILNSIRYYTYSDLSSDTYISQYITVRNSMEYVTKSFEMPATYHEYYSCYQPVLSAIRGMVNSHVSEMVSAGNIEGAISTLGGNQTNNILELVRNKKLEELEEINSKIRIYTIRQDENRLKEWEERKVRVNLQLSDMSERVKDMLNDLCVICYGEKKKPVMEIGCKAVFCGECLLKWLKEHKSCPNCRKDMVPSDMVYINEEMTDETEKKDKKTKMTKNETILKILDNNKDGKIVIFSNHDATFNTLFQTFSDNEIKYDILRGTTKHRDNILEKFKNGETSVLLLNSTTNAAGINLREATDIILYHDMTDILMNQIIGRANRLGRNIDLRVHHLV